MSKNHSKFAQPNKCSCCSDFSKSPSLTPLNPHFPPLRTKFISSPQAPSNVVPILSPSFRAKRRRGAAHWGHLKPCCRSSSGEWLEDSFPFWREIEEFTNLLNHFGGGINWCQNSLRSLMIFEGFEVARSGLVLLESPFSAKSHRAWHIHMTKLIQLTPFLF